MKGRIRIAQVLWLLTIVGIVFACALNFNPAAIQTDVRALLPKDEQTQTASEVLTGIADRAAQNLFVLVRAKDDRQTQELARAVERVLQASGLEIKKTDASLLTETSKALLPYREHFITQQSREWLQTAVDDEIVRRALKNLYRPVSLGLFSWENDPLGLFAERFQEVFSDGRFSVRGDFVTVADPKDTARPWILMTIRVESALQLGKSSVTSALDQARAFVAGRFPEGEILASGPALISEAAAGQASRESSLIGSVSAVALTLLILVFLRSLSAVGAVLGVLAISFAVAFGTVWLVFDGIHLITVVFGTTLLGVAADYVFHYLTELFHSADTEQARNSLIKGLTVSLVSSVAGYAVMLVIPMPSLKQMALFCIVGLTSAWLCVILFLPSLMRVRAMPVLTRSCNGILVRTLSIRSATTRGIVLAVGTLVALTGIVRLTTTDELRLLTKLPDALMSQQSRVAQILAPESPAQFFVVRGKTSDEVVVSVQALVDRLHRLESTGVISGSRTGLGILTSEKEQVSDYQLVHEANERARRLVAQKLSTQVKEPQRSLAEPLTVSQWLAMSVSEPFQSFWIDQTQVLVMLSGVRPDSLPQLEKVADRIPQVEFVNTTGEISSSLAAWRDLVTKVLAGAFAAMAVILLAVYGKSGFRMLVPSALGILVTMGIVGWLSLPFCLFTVLPLILLLALGVDYSVLLYSSKSNATAHLSVFLAAVSTMLSFGLLSFSATPALHYFGVTLAVGIVCVWVITMVMRPLVDTK